MDAKKIYSTEVSPISQTFSAGLVVAAIAAVFIFGPHRDPAKVVAGVPCSVIPETSIGAAVGTPVRLLPTTGTTCEYVSTGEKADLAVFVTAHEGAGRKSMSVAVVGPQGAAELQRDRARLLAMMRPRRLAAR